MTHLDDDTLTRAYERLTSALEAPPAHHDLIATRRRELRRRRRTLQGLAVAGVAAVVVGAAAVTTIPDRDRVPVTGAVDAGPAAAPSPSAVLSCEVVPVRGRDPRITALIESSGPSRFGVTDGAVTDLVRDDDGTLYRYRASVTESPSGTAYNVKLVLLACR